MLCELKASRCLAKHLPNDHGWFSVCITKRCYYYILRLLIDSEVQKCRQFWLLLRMGTKCYLLHCPFQANWRLRRTRLAKCHKHHKQLLCRTFRAWLNCLTESTVFFHKFNLLSQFCGKNLRFPFFRFISEYLFFSPDFLKKSEILPSKAPTNHPTILLDILGLVDLKQTFSYLGKLYLVLKYFKEVLCLLWQDEQVNHSGWAPIALVHHL